MEDGSSSKEVGTSSNSQGKTTSKMAELETLQKMYREKSSKVQELRSEIKSVKHRVEEDIPDECRDGFKALSKKYDRLRTEYYALLPKKEELEK